MGRYGGQRSAKVWFEASKLLQIVLNRLQALQEGF